MEGDVVVDEGGDGEVRVVVALLHAALHCQLAPGGLLKCPGVQLRGWVREAGPRVSTGVAGLGGERGGGGSALKGAPGWPTGRE